MLFNNFHCGDIIMFTNKTTQTKQAFSIHLYRTKSPLAYSFVLFLILPWTLS